MNLKKVRMDLHQIPELSKQEFETKKYILNHLQKMNTEIFEIGETGVVAYFDFGKNSSICFRADMDALPILEKNEIEYKSKNINVMHACAHDGHMTMLLGLCEHVSKLSSYTYNIVCLFQPSEEVIGGARGIIESGILEKLNVSSIFGMHIWPGLEKGQIYTMPKGMLAKSAEVDIKIIGKSIHAANRSLGIDSIVVASKYLIDLYAEAYKLKERHLLNFGRIEGGTLRNIVAGETNLNATMRAFDEETFEVLEKNLYEVAKKYENIYGCKFNIEVRSDFPCVYNNPTLVKKMKFAKILEAPFMQAEDFGLYTKIYPCVFFLLGCGKTSSLHTNTFDFDMDILANGLNLYKKILSIMQNK